MKRLVYLTVVAWCGSLLLAVDSGVAADLQCKWVTTSKIVKGHVETSSVKRCTRVKSPAQVVDADSSASTSPATNECQRLAERYDVDADEYCSNTDWAPPRTAGQPLTRTTISQAFKTLDLPPSKLVIEPPDGRTLVNFDTNFYVDEKIIQRTVTLLGQPVHLRVWAASYTWHFDDGESLTTIDPGAPYPDLRVTYNYLRKGTYQPRVDTTYQAEFRIGHGRWLPVPGTTTVTGKPARLRAIEATPKLVAPYGRDD
ncbi:MAG: hypothetical protein L0H31_05900 [Nocardioidaceae bacterium]|nr:hypothetical protein [Nocardioidaceae bacterium]